MRNSSEFNAEKSIAEANGISRFPVDLPIKEAVGPNYNDQVSGVTRVGSKNHPTGNPAGSLPPKPTEFNDQSIVKGIYDINPDGTINTHTIYPRPKP